MEFDRKMRRDVLRGALAGFTATGAMTGFAVNWLSLRHPDFPRHHHPLSIVQWANARLGNEDPLPESSARPLARALHYGFGALSGIAFSIWVRKLPIPLPWPVRGAMFAWFLWVIAFCGYIPGLGIYKPAWRFELPERETTFLSHTVYGMTLAALLEALESDTAREPEDER